METIITNSEPIAAETTAPVALDQTARRRTGKVALLPVDVRRFVNEQLDNSVSYLAIATELNQKGYPAIAEHNIGRWARGGYQDYLREKRRDTVLRESSDKMLNLAASLNDDSRAGFEKVSASLVAAKIIDAIQDFDSKRLHRKLTDQPELFFRAAKVVNSQSMDFSRLRKVELEFQKYRDHVAEQKRKMEEAMKPVKRAQGLTKEQIAEIHEAMRML